MRKAQAELLLSIGELRPIKRDCSTRVSSFVRDFHRVSTITCTCEKSFLWQKQPASCKAFARAQSRHSLAARKYKL